MRTMVPPQYGQRHAPATLAGASRAVELGRKAACKSRWQTGSNWPRRRLARKPQNRIRTKPRGSVWSRKRRRNSSCGDRHHALLTLVGIVFPAEGDLAIGKVDDPVVGDGDAMSVAAR